MQRIDEAQSADPAKTVRFAVIVPAYRPEEALLQLIAALSEKPIPAIVLVDDGSGPDSAGIFRRAREFAKVHLVRHAVNLGKGAALKSGINYALCTFPELQGVITADADGQHHPDDIQAVAERLAAAPDHLVLGTRTFSGDIPFRSRVGNVLTRTVMAALVGQHVSDTQTGLRGIPSSLLPHLLHLESNGYDFELDMLIAVRQRSMHIDEVPIRTIYEPGNRTSHFNPLIDSMKIYFVLLRFSSVSLMSGVLDTLVFYIAYRRLGNLAASQVIGRILAVAFNYSMVRRAVFFSKLRHASVLPKYLLLVCLSLSASYAGIQLLGSRFHIQPLPAKLLVETLLFFANFAIQRDFIFGKTGEPAWIDRLPRWIPLALLTVLALVLLGTVAHGVRATHLLADSGWTQAGKHRFIRYTWIFAAASSALVLTVPAAFAPLLAGLMLLATSVAIGPLAVLIVAAFLISACALGTKLLGLRHDPSADSQLIATLAGIAVYIFLMTFLARLPVNYPIVYAILLAIPVLIDIRGVARRLAAWGRALVLTRPRPRSQVAAFALLAFVMGVHWLIVPQPESSADGLAMHLAIPVNISLHHMLTYQPGRIIWSVMPMGADWCFTMVYLLAGEFAARLLNFAMLLLVAALLYRAVRRWVSPAIAFLILALFASTSMVQLVTGSLMVENFLAAMVLGSVAAIWRFDETGERRFLYAAAAIGGTAMAIKLGGLAFFLPVVPFAVIAAHRHWKRLGSLPLAGAASAILLLLLVATPPYIIAWRMTRNPLFPFMNLKFPSPLIDRTVSFADNRFSQPLTFHTPYDLTFRTDHFYEGRPGSLGFAYLLLAPLGLAAAVLIRQRPAGSAAIVSLAGALIVLVFLPNARYLYPAMPLLLVPLGALFGWLSGPWKRALIGLAAGCVGLNAWFLPASNFYHGNFYEQAPLSRGARQVYIHKVTPMREIGEYMNRVHPGAPILLAGGNDIAAFNAEVYASTWHQFNIWTRLLYARSSRDVYQMLRQWNVRYVAAPKPAYQVNIDSRALQNLLNECGIPEFTAGSLYLARLEDGCGPTAPDRRVPLPVSPGFTDDYDPALTFHGMWTRDESQPRFFSHTLTYSGAPGAEARIAFQGTVLTFYYVKGPDRGMAEVTIDGTRKETVDLYSPKIAWESRSYFRNLAAGPHLAVISVLAQKNPNSSAGIVDVDGFDVQ